NETAGIYLRFSYVLLKNDCLTMSATVSGTGNLELIQKHNFRSLRAQIVYTHYRKNKPSVTSLGAPSPDGF
ncbi:TPA: hypothetical protein ACG6LC_002015, partial [Streptococcus agalactiae]